MLKQRRVSSMKLKNIVTLNTFKYKCVFLALLSAKEIPLPYFFASGDGALLCRNLVGGEDYVWQMLFVRPEGQSFEVLRFNSLS